MVYQSHSTLKQTTAGRISTPSGLLVTSDTRPKNVSNQNQLIKSPSHLNTLLVSNPGASHFRLPILPDIIRHWRWLASDQSMGDSHFSLDILAASQSLPCALSLE